MRMKSQTVKLLLAMAFFAAALVLLVVYFALVKPEIADRTGWLVGLYIPAGLFSLAGAGLIVSLLVTAFKKRK